MRTALYQALTETDPAQKCRRVAALVAGEWREQLFPDAVRAIPGRPDAPALIAARDVPHRGLGTAEGRAALIHAIAHIEFNAINLALDAAWRFGGMPAAFYADWISVAQDEARHFQMLQQRLAELGHAYGDFPAHNGLWEAAERTADDVMVRMALVPRVLEARGLDVTPGMIRRLGEQHDHATVAALEVILAEEVRHVAIGTHWFRMLCEQRGLPPETTFLQLLEQHQVRIRPPLNRAARHAAGFVDCELGGVG